MRTPREILEASASRTPDPAGPPHGDDVGTAFLAAALALALVAPCSGLAVEAKADQGESAPAPLDPRVQRPPDWYDRYLLAQNPPGSDPPGSDPASPGAGGPVPGAARSYLPPVWEIIGFNVLLNRIDYAFVDKQVYGVTLSSIRENLSHKWVVDTDPFAVNQFMHPYQGSVYFGFARATGFDYWESLGYTFGGSLLWEIAGETGLPSINDLVATGIGGTFLGEPLFRMASLVLEGGGETPGFWRELGAAVISPPLGFTRLAFGDRFRTVFDSRDAAVFSYLRLGWNKVDAAFDEAISQKGAKRNVATSDFRLAYGLPGKDGYTYTRPFDYFDFEFTSTNLSVFENIMSRGLLVGKAYEAGDAYRGVWGLYGSYDYISPQIFRVSTTALSLGTTAQWWISKEVALQGTLLGGVGYGAAGTIRPTGERDYHYGATPQALLALRLMFGEAVNLDLAARSYYVSDVFSTENRGAERIYREDVALTARIYGPHAVTLKYNTSRRNAHYPDVADTRQTVTSLSLLYTYFFGDGKFGAVEWRTGPGAE